MHRRWWMVCFFYATVVLSKAYAGDLAAEIESALSRAGENRPQIQAALDKAPPGQLEGMRFLVAYMPEPDLRKLSSDFLLENVDYAYRALNESPWKNRVPKDVFLNYLLPYASIDERRDNWRKDFYERFKPLVAGIDAPDQACTALDQKIFPLLKVRFSTDRPKANQSPYETIEVTRASCTGMSVLLIDACRAVGVPARFVGTHWTDKSGNHSWLEIWDGADWQCTDAAGDGLGKGWFIGRAATAQRDHPLHAIYAARYEKSPQFFPAAWSPRQTTFYAINVTDRYTKNSVKRADGEIVIRFRMLDQPQGQRVAAKVKLSDAAGKVIAEGPTRDERFDPNNHFEAVVAKDLPLRVELRMQDRQLVADIQPQKDEELFTFYLADAKVRSLPRGQLDPLEQAFAESEPGRKVTQLLAQYFDAAPEKRSVIEFDPALDKLVLEHSSAVRKLAWKAYLAGYEVRQFRPDLESHRVSYEHLASPYAVHAVGTMPADGWPLFIAMHGGGGVPTEINDSQWQVMQHYYRDQPSLEGYLYLAIRAPNDIYNGFSDWYNLELTDRLKRELVAEAKVDPNKVFLMGYSHGGYGAFFTGTRIADHFAAVHASAAAPNASNEDGKNLRNTTFTFMIGEHDKAYGRIERCRDFDKYMNGLRGDRHDIYPVTMEYKEGFHHSDLPDRDKIKDMYAATRNPIPREITWLRMHNQVKDFYWLRIDRPTVGQQIMATCRDNELKIEGEKLDEFYVDLDERLVDYTKPLTIQVGDDRSTQPLQPSLRTLCDTLAERGDPELMFATRVTLKFPTK